jgi:hypothetical protein
VNRNQARLPDGVGPNQVLAALEAAGFTEYSRGNGGSYVRMEWPKTARGTGRSIMVPMNHAAPEYEQMMTGLLAELFGVAAAGAAATLALTVLGAAEEAKPEPAPVKSGRRR